MRQYLIRPKFLGVFVLMVCALTACRQCSNDVIKSFPSPEDEAKIDRSLVTGDPCSPPCWQGIYPGSTRGEDVIVILRDLDFIDTDSFQHADESVFWDSAISDTNTWLGAVDVADRIVSEIRIRQIEYDLTLGELISIYGNPDGVGASQPIADAPPCFTFGIMWVTQGFSVSLPSIHQRDLSQGHPLVTADTRVIGVGYFLPADSLQAYIDRTGYGGIQEWDGYENVSVPWLSEK
jgi:hypothetical protein